MSASAGNWNRSRTEAEGDNNSLPESVPGHAVSQRSDSPVFDLACLHLAASHHGEVDRKTDPDPVHCTMILKGLCALRAKGILCDVTLLAEEQRFDVHKVILVSCSDYFRSMFTSGMKECNQSEIELKGVTAKGLEKVLDIIYTSTTQIDGDDVFDIIAAATHLQVIPVLEFCEKNFLSGMNTSNFSDFISTARLYNMGNVLTQIDKFIATNLLQIAREPSLNMLSYDQILCCLQSPHCNLQEIDLFNVISEWVALDPSRDRLLEGLLSEIHFTLIAPADLVGKVQDVSCMMANPKLHNILLRALNYHVVPHSQPLRTPHDMGLRCCKERIVCVGGRELHPHPGLIQDCFILPHENMTQASLLSRHILCALPSPVSHAQVLVFNNFMFVLGGCVTQCGHGETAVNSVLRYDMRFNTWFQCASMAQKRAYFFAGVIGNQIIAVGGRKKEGGLSQCELYHAEDNSWHPAPSLQSPFHAHAGVVMKDTVYISGGYSNDNFYPDMHRLRFLGDGWEECSPMLTARGWHCMVQARSHLFVCGGCSLNANNQALPVLQCEQYNPQTDQWTILSTLPVTHKEASAIVHNDQIYILGGYNVQTKTGQKQVSRLDLNTNQWTPVGTLPQSITGMGSCVLKLPPFLSNFEDL